MIGVSRLTVHTFTHQNTPQMSSRKLSLLLFLLLLSSTSPSFLRLLLLLLLFFSFSFSSSSLSSSYFLLLLFFSSFSLLILFSLSSSSSSSYMAPQSIVYLRLLNEIIPVNYYILPPFPVFISPLFNICKLTCSSDRIKTKVEPTNV
jgi:Zn-dependent protease with chaperone function